MMLRKMGRSPASFVNPLAPRTISPQYSLMTRNVDANVVDPSRKFMLNENLKFNTERRELFLTSLATRGDFGVACLDTEISYETVRRHMLQDDVFAEGVARARSSYLAHLRKSAYNRAVHGVVSRETWDENGKLIQQVHTYSDALLIKLLNRHDPEFRDSFKIEANVNAKVEAKAAQQVDLEAAMKKLSPEKRKLLRQILEEATAPDEPQAQLSEHAGQLSDGDGANSQSTIDV